MNRVEQLLNGAMPDGDYVRQQLDANEEILFGGIMPALINGIRNQINHNADALERVEKRIRSSVNGHIRKNTGLMKPIVMALYDAVHNEIDNIQASVNQIASRPDVQDWLKRQPHQPPWGGVVPAPPGAGDLSGGADVQVVEALPKPNAAGKTSYYLWYHCGLGAAIAIPNQAADQLEALIAQGWRLWPGNAVYQAANESEARQYLASQRDKIARLCEAG